MKKLSTRRTRRSLRRSSTARRHVLAGSIAGLIATLFGVRVTQAANSELDVLPGATDLTLDTSYQQATAPTTTSDITFTNSIYSPSAFSINGNTALSIGTLNDLDTNDLLSISNATLGTIATLTLNGGGDTVPGSVTGDLLYVANGANLALQSSAGTLGVVLTTAGNFDVAGTASIGSIISGAGIAITKTGAGTLTLSGANTFSGGLTVAAGTVIGTTSASAFGANTGAITLGDTTGANSASLLIGTTGLTYANPIVLATGTTGTLTLGTTGTGVSTTFSGGVTGANNLTLSASSTTGTLTLATGAVNNAGSITNVGTGTGAATISAAINSNVTGLIQTSGTSQLNATGTITPGATFQIVNNATSGTAIVSASTIGATTANSVLTLSNNSAIGAQTPGVTTGGVTVGAINHKGTIVSNGTGTGSTVITGVIGTNVTGLTVTGTSPLILEGVNTFTGASAISIASGATLQLGNASTNNQILVSGAGIADAGTLIFAPGTSSLTYGNVISGAGSIVLNGSTSGAPANITLSANNGSFTGGFVVNQGRFQINAQNNLGSAANAVTVNGNGAALTGGQILVNATNITLANPITINGYGPTESAGNLGAIRLNQSGDVYSGTITLGSNASINTMTATGTVSGLITGGSDAQLLIGAPISGTGAGNNGSTTGILTLTHTNTYSGGTLIQGETAALGAVGALGTGPVIVSTTSASGLTESVANALTGTNSLTVNGGTATLSQVNNYTGDTVLNGGTLNNNAAGAISSLNLIVNGGTFAQTAILNGAGQSVVINGGTVNFSQANTYNSGTTLNGGTLNASVANAIPAGLVVNGGTLNLSAAGALSFATVNGGTVSSSLASGAVNSALLTVNGGTIATPAAGGSFGAVNAANGTNFIAPGGNGLIGSATFTSLGTGAGTTLQIDGGLPGQASDTINVTGSNLLALGDGTTLSFLNGAPSDAGNYRLIGYSGATPTIPASLLPTSPRAGVTYAFDTVSDPGFIDLKVANTSAAVNATFLPADAATTYSYATPTNWSGGIVPNVGGDTANFTGMLAADETVTLDAPQHVGNVILNPASGDYILAAGNGGMLVLDNGTNTATVQSPAGVNSITAPVNLLSNSVNFTVGASSVLSLTGQINGPGRLVMGGDAGFLVLDGPGLWTGGTEIDSGAIVLDVANATVTQLNNAGVGVTTLNGGMLIFTSASGQDTLPSGFVLNFGPNGGILATSGMGTAGKVLANSAPNFLTGSGTFTKQGGGDLQDGSPSVAFTGNVNVQGLIEVQNTAALGTVGTLDVQPGGEIVSSGIAIINPITLSGGILSANSGSNLARFATTVNVTADSTLAARQFQSTSTPENFAIGTLTGSGNLTVVGNTTGSQGLVTLGNASGYTGKITVGANGALGIGDSTGGNFFGSNNPITFTSTSGLGLVSDGDSTGAPQVINFTLPSNPLQFTTLAEYFVAHAGGGVTGALAANKTISLSTPLPNSGTNSITVTPLNGYGLLLTAQPALTATETYSVNGTQASNVIAGLTLQNLTGAFGIVKTGTGTLQLGTSVADASNTFGGTGTLIDIQGGTVAALSDAGLGAATNGIKLNNTTAAELLAEGTFATSRIVTLATATGDTIGVSAGNTLTINSGLAYSAAGNVLNKVEDGTLVLTAAATGSPTSATNVTAGILSLAASNEVGTGTITVSNAGSALQLRGGSTFTQAVTISNSGVSGTRGALDNLSGANTLSGTLTISGGALVTNEDSANTLTLGAVANNTTGFNVGGPGNVTINGVISGGGVVNATGPGTLTITAAMTDTGTTTAYGPLTLSGNGKFGSGGVAVALGGVLTFDNQATNVNSRINGHTLGFSGGGGGTVKIIGNAGTATTESFLGFQTGRGEDVLMLNPNAAQSVTATLTSTSGSFVHNSFTSVIYQAPGLGSAAAAGVGVINEGSISNTGFVGAATAGGGANQQIQPWALAYNTTNANGLAGITFATANGATGQNYRPLSASESAATIATTAGTISTTNASTTVTVGSTTGLFAGESVSGSGIPAGAYIASITDATHYVLSAAATAGASNVAAVYATTGDNITATTAIDASGAGLNTAINSLTLATGGSLTLGNQQTLTIGGSAGGGILATDLTNGATISGPGILTAGANELDIHTVGDLTISSTITGGGGGSGVGLTKGESGTLTLAAASFHNGQTVVNGGTLSLAAGNNTIHYTNYIALGAGASLNLNGNNQIVTDLISDSTSLTGLGTIGATNSTVTGQAGSLLVLKRDATSRSYTGTISGGLGLVVSSTSTNTWTLTGNESYTGPTLINGGTVVLANAGAFSATSALTIDHAGLTLDNTGSQDSATRLPSDLPISLGGGTLSYLGRAQFNTAETIGAVTATEGANVISVTQQTTGISSETLTLGGLTRTAGATVNFTNSNGALGLIGSNPHIVVNGGLALTNGILGGGFTVNGTDFASYNPTLGVGGLSQVGFAGYTPQPLNTAGPADNVSMSTSTGVALNDETINSLRVTGSTTIAFNPGQTLTLATGGLLVTSNLTMGSSADNGFLTSGGNELFLYVNGGTNVINSAITGTGMSLVKSGGGNITIAGTNTYDGGTVVDQATLTLAGTGTLGTGGITLNGGTFVQSAGGVIPSQAVAINGASTLTLAGNNSIASLTFTNDGGNTAPNLSTTGGVLTIASGNITASSSNVGSTSVISAGTVDLNGTAAPTITVNPIAFNGQSLAPLQPTLSIAAVIQNASNPLTVTGGGNLQLSGASTFTGGVNLASGTSLTIAGNSTNTPTGQPVSGPLGTGILNIGAGSTLLPDSGQSRTVGNNVVVGGDFAFDVSSGSNATLTLGQGGNTIALPAGANTVISVNSPNATGAFAGSVTGAGSSIEKKGLGNLLLNNTLGGANTFSGGVIIDAGTLTAVGFGASSTALGTGTVTINGGVLALHNNGVGSGGVVTYGNNVLINSALANAFIDVNNNGSGTNNTLVLGSLGYTGFTNGSAAPTTILNVTGGNGYKLQFASTNLTTASSSPVFNVASGLTLVLPGGFTVGTNLPTNLGLGTLAYSGNNIGGVAAPITGVTQVDPLIAQSSNPLGTGGLTLSNGSTLQIAPLYSNSINATGYVSGGMTGKYYFTGATTMASASNFGLAPNSQLVGEQPNDSALKLSPAGVNTTSVATSLSVYQGLLNVTTGGTYYFGGGSDDQLQVTVDGQIVLNDLGGHALNQLALQSITLAPGQHQVVVREFNNGSGGGLQVVYSGPDTASNGITGGSPVSNLQALPLSALSYATGYTAANGYQNAAILNNPITVSSGSATIDGLGTDFNSAVPSLTLGANATLKVANGTGAAGSFGNGVFIVTGLTDTTAGTGATVSPGTGTLVLAGGVNDSGHGLTKTGQGNLILGGSAGTFTGALNINDGFVQLQDPNGLTTGTTTIGAVGGTPATLDLNGQTVTTTGDIVLNGGAGPGAKSSAAGAGLYNSSATTAVLPAGGTLSIGAAIGSVNPTLGGFGDIVLNGTVRDAGSASAWTKVGPDTLVLNGANTFGGTLTINGGLVQLGNAAALGGTSGGTVVASGATLDLNGQTLGAEPISLNGTGLTGVANPNALGALINSSATDASTSGTVTLAANSTIGGPSLLPGTNGGITLSGQVNGAFQLIKVGSNALTLTHAAGAETLIDLQNGSVTLSGNGAIAASSNANLVRSGTTLTLDNSGTAASNRLGGHGLYLSGELVIKGGASNVQEVINQGGNNINISGTFANGFGGAVITLAAAGTGGLTLQVADTATSIFTRAAGGTLLLRGDNLGGTPGANTATVLGNATSLGYSANNGQSVGQAGTYGAANTLIYPWAIVDNSATGLGTSFATYKDNTNGIVSLQSSGGFVATAPALTLLNVNTNATTTVTTTSTAGLSVGMAIQGVGIPAGATISSITNGTTFVISAAATVTGNNTLTFSTGGVAYPNLVSTAATNTVGSAGVAQELNSITLNNPAGAELDITTGLQLDSGGILAVGTDGATTNYTIGGTGLLTGTNNLNRELIFHVVGNGTTLAVDAPIYVNGGGLTKADDGTLVLDTQETFLGDLTINGGLLKLNAGQNTIFKPYSTAPSVGNSGVGITSQNLTVDAGGTLDLNGANQAVGNLRSGSTVQLQGGTIENSRGTATLDVALNGNNIWAGNLSNAGGGTLNFVRDGNNTLTINSPQTMSGSVTTLGGGTALVDLGTFENASSLTVTRSAFIWNDTGVQAVSNRLPATMPITLNGGGFQFQARAGSGATPTDAISLGTLNLGIGSSDVLIGTLGQGTAGQITFAGLGTRALGSTLNFGAGSLSMGDNPHIYFTSAPTLTNGLIGAWATVTGSVISQNAAPGTNIGAGFATYDPASGIRAVIYEPAGVYGTSINGLVTANTTLPAGGAALNSLTMGEAGVTLGFATPGDTLTIQSGGILTGTDNNGKAIGTAASPGQIVSGAGNDLYVHVGANTLTINAKILDNGSNNNLIVDAPSTSGASLTLTNANSYGGTTYLSGATLNLNSATGPAIPGDLVISGGNNAAADSLAFNQTNLQFDQANQLVSTANVTLNGQVQFYMGAQNALNTLTGNSQTIASLTFNDDGGLTSATAGGPTVYTGTGTLTIDGTITSQNLASVATVPTINGFLNLTTGNIVVDANQYAPGQIGLSLNANLTAAQINKSGLGTLGIGGQSSNFTGPLNVNAGGLAWAQNGALLGGRVNLAANTVLDSRGLTGTIGSLASTSTTAVVQNGLQSASGTVVIGLDGTDSTYAGIFATPYANALLNITKIGAGTLELTGDSTGTNNGTLTASNGIVKLDSPTGRVSFTSTTLQAGGTILLDSSTSPLNNRLGGATLGGTAATLTQNQRSINMNGGELIVTGNAGTAVSEALGSFGSLNGGGILTLNATGSAGVSVFISAMQSQNDTTSLLIRGDNLGMAAGPGVATLQFASAAANNFNPGVAFPSGQGNGANGTVTRTIRPDILVDPSATGTGTSFLTVDSVTGLVRPLAANEYLGTFVASTSTTNVGLSGLYTMSAPSAVPASVVASSLTLNSGGGVDLEVVPSSPWGANAGLLNVNLQGSGGLLALTGNTGITAGEIQSSANVTLDFQVPAADNSFALNAAINSQNGWVKSGAGTLLLEQPYYTNGQVANTITVAGGTIQLGAGLGTNPLFVQTTSTTPTGTALNIQNGTLDLNGNNQLVGAITTSNAQPFDGGTAAAPGSVVTNTSATPATFSTNNTNSTVSTVITGNLSFDKSGSGTITLTSPQSYTGTTTVRGGTLSLRDSASIASNAAIKVFYGGLQLDNSGLSDNTNRISSTAPITLNGAGLKFLAGQRVESESIGAVTASQGSNEINITSYNNSGNSSTYTVNVANLAESNYATLNVQATVNGSLGGSNGANQRLFLTEVNGAPFSSASLVDGIIAPWMTVNQNDWATYSNTNGVTSPNNNGTPNYSSALLPVAGLLDNVTTSVNIQGAATRTINTLAVRSPSAATIVSLGSAQDQLTLAGGGLLVNSVNSSGTAEAVTIQGGSITAGQVNQPSTLYLTAFNNGGLTLNSILTDNGTGPLTFVRSGNATVTLTPENIALAGYANASTTVLVQNLSGISAGQSVTGTGIAANTVISSIGSTVAPAAVSSTTTASSATVAVNTAGLFVGESVTGTGIPAGEYIASITDSGHLTLTTSTGVSAGTNSLTYGGGVLLNLSNATTAAASGGAGELAIVPFNTNGVGATTQGSNTLSIAASSLPANFTPAIGMTIGAATQLAGGTTITGVSLSGGTYTLTLSQPATTTAASGATFYFNSPSETYSGLTVVNSGTLSTTGGTLNLSGLPGAITVPGDLIVNGSTVTMNTNQGQIAATSNVTVNGSGTLNLVGTNTLNSLTFNNTGGGVTPTVGAATLLNLSSATPITAVNDSSAFTPTVSGTAVNFTNPGGATLNVSGASLNDLAITAQITSAGPITKSGTGSLALPNANAATLNWNLANGALVLGNATALGASGSTLNITGPGTLLAGTAALTVATPITLSPGASLTFGGNSTLNGLTLSGPMNLGGATAPVVFTVTGLPVTGSITGIVSNATGGITKAGPGTLNLGAANTFTGPINVTGGVLKQGVASAFGSANSGADYTIATTAAIDINNIDLNVGSLSGGGLLTNSGGSAHSLAIGTGANATNAVFSGSLAASTPANLTVTKTGSNNQTLSGQSTYTGPTNVLSGTLTLANSRSAGSSTLANTAVSVSAGQTLAINAGAGSSTVSIGNTGTASAGASLLLNAGSTNNPGANFTMADALIGIFNLLGGSSAAGGLTIGGTGSAMNAPTLTFDLGASSIDQFNVTHGVMVGASGGLIAIDSLGSAIAPGDYTFMTAASGLGVSGLTLANTTLNAGGHTYSLSLADSTATAEILTVGMMTSTLANAYWDGAQSGTWNTFNGGATNFSTSPTSVVEAGVLPAFDTNVYFTVTNPPGAANLTTTLGEDFAINSLNFLGTGTSATDPVSITGNTLTLNATEANGNTLGNGITVAPGNGAVTIGSAVVIATSQVWTNNSSSLLTINGTSVSGAGNSLTIDGSGNTTIAANIQTGTGSLNKQGSGTLILSGANTYTGATSIKAGTLELHGSLSGDVDVFSGATFDVSHLTAGTYHVANGRTLSSTGESDAFVTGALTADAGGTIAPGGEGAIGSLNISTGVSFALNSTLAADLAPGASDQIHTPSVTLDGATLSLSLLGGYNPDGDGSLFVLIDNTGASAVNGTFATNPMVIGGTFGDQPLDTVTATDGELFAVSYTGDAATNSFTGGNDVVLMAVPEPSAAGILLTGLAALAGLQRFRRRAARAC